MSLITHLDLTQAKVRLKWECQCRQCLPSKGSNPALSKKRMRLYDFNNRSAIQLEITETTSKQSIYEKSYIILQENHLFSLDPDSGGVCRVSCYSVVAGNWLPGPVCDWVLTLTAGRMCQCQPQLLPLSRTGKKENQTSNELLKPLCEPLIPTHNIFIRIKILSWVDPWHQVSITKCTLSWCQWLLPVAAVAFVFYWSQFCNQFSE